MNTAAILVLASAASVLPGILQLLLDEPAPTAYVCEAPFVEPRPGFGDKRSCGAKGLRAAQLNTRAARFYDRGRTAEACAVVANYNGCEFPRVRTGRECSELKRSFDARGVAANTLEEFCN